MPKGIRTNRFRLIDLPGVLFNAEGDAGGSGSTPTPDPAAPPAPAPTPPATDEPGTGDDDKLGEPGKKALETERAAKRAAEKRAKDAETELQKFREANQSEAEKALAAARKEGEAAARAASAPKLVAAEFKAAAAGRLTAEQLAGFIEDLDLTKYLTEDGEVDTERVAKKVDLLAPEKREQTPPFHGGARKTASARAGSLGEAITNRLAGNKS